MLKINFLSSLTKNCRKLQHEQGLGQNCDIILYRNKKLALQEAQRLSYLPISRHISSVSCYHRPYRLYLQDSCRNPLTRPLGDNLLTSGVTGVLFSQQQHRQFSLKSSIESLIATQAGIFKTISESTPVEYCQKYLLYIHEVTGLPWWASIILSTIIIRSFVTPLAVYQQVIMARLENIKQELPEIANELRKETSVAVKLYNWDEKTAKMAFKRSMGKQWNKLIIRENCHPLKTTILVWFQIPLWISLSVSLRNLVYMLPTMDINAQITFGELVRGGFAFIPNLTIPDASWIFPVTLGLLNLAIIEVQLLSRDPTRPTTKLQRIITNFFRGISVIMIPISACVPSCLVLYWTTSSACGLLQNLILMSPKVKRLCKIPKTQVEVMKPYKMITENLKYKFKLT